MRPITYALSIIAFAAGSLVSADKYPNGFGTGCTLVKSSIYCYGGSPSPADYNFVNATKVFYSLDVSSTVNMQNDQSSWVSLPVNGTNAPKENMLFGMAAFADSDTFIMSGGTGIAGENQALPHQTVAYNTSSDTWSTIDTSLFVQTKLNILTVNADTGNSMFMFGGVSDLSTGFTTIEQVSKKEYPSRPKLLGYANNGWTWSYGNAANPNDVAVVGRERHTVAQGKDGRFYVLGGQTAAPNKNATQQWPYGMADADMDYILIYDVSKGWTKEMMQGDIPSKRWHPSSVTLNDGSILLYGGAKPGWVKGPNNENYLEPVDDVAYVLNTQTGTWENVTPRITTNGANSRDGLQFQRFGHSMVRVSNNNVFILFGRTKDIKNAEGYIILDTSSWTLVDIFDGVTSPGDAQGMDGQTPNDSDGLSGGAIAGIVVGVVVGVGLIAGILAFIFIRRRRNARQQKQSIMNANPSHDDDWHHHQPTTPTDDMYSSSSTQVGETLPPISSVIYGGEAMKPESKDTPRLKLQPVKPDGA